MLRRTRWSHVQVSHLDRADDVVAPISRDAKQSTWDNTKEANDHKERSTRRGYKRGGQLGSNNWDRVE